MHEPLTPRFITGLHSRRVLPCDSDSCWELTAPLEFFSPTQGHIIVPAGFRTDYASVPRLPFTFALFGDYAHASATVHDYLCRQWVPSNVCTRAEADKVFLEAMEAEGVAAWRRRLMWLAVRIAGDARRTEEFGA